MSNLKYWIWLAGRKGLAGQSAMRVLERFGTPERVYFADPGEYRIPEVPAVALESLRDKSLDGANRILGDCDRLGIHVLTMQDAAYPERLAAIHQPPLLLYWKGRPLAFDEEAAIAIVGTRKATPYGVMAATKLSMDLTAAGALVVSGMAEGIDAAAVRGALKAGGPIVSVLAGGMDIYYPRAHRFLYADVEAAGTLISEYPPGTEHRGAHFPIRNRILSGLSVGVIAVESARTGGTMHTVGHALDQNREVFAVPGPMDAPQSEGANRLIQEGAAKLILSAEDVLCEFRDRFPNCLRTKTFIGESAAAQRLEDAAQAETAKLESQKRPAEKEVDIQPAVEYIDWQECKTKLTPDQQAVLLAFGEKSYRTDELVELAQIPARQVLSALTVLQVLGYVEEEPGKRFHPVYRLKME